MRHLYKYTPTKQSIYPPNLPFIDPMVDSVYSKNVLRIYSVETVPSGNAKSITIGNANNVLYGMDNYVNDLPHQGFHSTEECNIGNNIKE